MALSVNKPPTLKIKGNPSVNWRKWYTSFTTFLSAADLDSATDTRKIALLINLIGDDAPELMNNFTWDKKNDVHSFAKVVEKFEEYCIPIKNIVVERFNFNNVVQRDGETFESFLTELRTKASSCEFSTLQDSLIRDRIVYGLRDKDLQKRLLRETKLTLEKCVEFCIAAEQSDRQVKILQESAQVDDLRRRPHAKNVDGKSSEKKCPKCHRNHYPRKCPAFGKTCMNCRKKNHFSIACRAPKQIQGERNKSVQEIREEDSELNFEKFFISEVKNKYSSYAWYTELKINNIDVKFKLDSGAEVNVLPDSTFKMLATNKTLTESKTLLISYSNNKINTLGKIVLECFYKGLSYIVEFFVVEGNSQPILGLKTCNEIGLLRRVNEINKSCNIFELYNDVFTGIGKIDVEHHIVLDKTIPPVIHPPRRVPISIQSKFRTALDKLEAMDIIEKVDYPTDWVNSLVIVEKKDGDLRLCLDPKDLNKAIKREHFMIPTAQDINAKLSGKKIFSVIDMSSGFWHVKLDKESSDLCTFNTCFGRYKFLRLPFGISSAPEVFQKYVLQIFGDIKGVQVIFDDIIIAGKDEKEHDQILQEVFKAARKHNVRFNKTKIQLRVKSVKYMGNIISENGLQPDPEKVRAIIQMESPKCKEEVKRFLGMTNYLATFIPNLSVVNAPLRELVKNDVVWHWEQSQQKAFDNLKASLVKPPVIAFFDPKLEVTIQTDASKDGIGCCLLQNKKPVAYASRALTENEQRFAQIEKELLAIVYSLEKFHYFVYGKEVTIESDHKPLTTITTKDIVKTTPRLQRLLMKLLKYKIKVIFVPGSQMFLADTLSRSFLKDPVVDDPELDAVVHSVSKHLAMSDLKRKKITELTQTDQAAQILKKYCIEGWPEEKHSVPDCVQQYWKLRNELNTDGELIFMNDRLLIPSEFREEILQQIHEGHQGIEKCKQRARSVVYWPGISTQIEEMVKRCQICEKFQHQNTKENLIPHEIPDRPWKKIASDILTFKTRDYLIAIDYYSNWLEIIQLKGKTAQDLISKFREIFARNGIPEELVSDNMPYNSREFKKFAEEWDIKLTTSSPLYPQSNGMAERGVQLAKNILRKSYEERTDIYPLLLAYRNTPIKGTESSPAQSMMSRRLRNKLPILSKFLKPEIQNLIKEKKEEQQKTYKYYYNRHAKPLPAIKKGEDVWIKQGKEWETAKVIEEHEAPRSFIVKTGNQEYRRNRRDLRPFFNPSFPNRTPDLKYNNTKPSDLLTEQRPHRNIKLPVRYKDYIL